MSRTRYSAERFKDVAANVDDVNWKGVQMKSGETACGVGQVALRERSSNKYKNMGAFTDFTDAVLGATVITANQSFYGVLATLPILPNSLSGNISIDGTLATISDDGKGNIIEESNLCKGDVSYENGDVSIYSHGAIATTDLITISGTHIGATGMGAGMDLQEIGIVALATVDASAADAEFNAIVGGNVLAANLTPTVTIATENQYKLFKSAGITLINSAVLV